MHGTHHQHQPTTRTSMPESPNDVGSALDSHSLSQRRGEDYIAGTVARVAATVERDVAAFECTRERERIVCRWAEGPAALAATVVQCVPLVAAVPPTGRPHEIPSGDAHQCKLMHT